MTFLFSFFLFFSLSSDFKIFNSLGFLFFFYINLRFKDFLFLAAPFPIYQQKKLKLLFLALATKTNL